MQTSIAPLLSVRSGARAVEFYKAAFGAREVYRVDAPDGAVVSRLSIDGAEFWVSDAQVLAAGAREVFAVEESHDWRLGGVADPFGHHWEIGHPLT